jgi:hypothetical protein
VGDRPVEGLATRYRRLVQPVVRGPVAIAVTVGVFAGAGALGGRFGLILASLWVMLMGIYCVANFSHCQETHCVVTGGGWVPLALLGLAAALLQGKAMSWYHVGTTEMAFVVILAGGYTFECMVAARTGRHRLGRGRDVAQSR